MKVEGDSGPENIDEEWRRWSEVRAELKKAGLE